ncbi:hypothetical protein CRM90_26105 [Mycobacterium sp. ENV421]|uniref:hypothetical protein n=1 Tax=Mycobacterium sp. ENV421 TaxID=1213407 RepID=UPI000C9A2FD5|nr:hypothetical protein [Mycobacterium sp. ENV421]PND54776.1 hypothetical protein CRM90_26105 [Mycobacterium sp. ENV421]
MLTVVAAHRDRRDVALNRLPPAYSEALRLRDAGLSDELIADRIGVEREAIATFMTLAEAKLAAIAAVVGEFDGAKD